jgi:hypothetical protein
MLESDFYLLNEKLKIISDINHKKELTELEKSAELEKTIKMFNYFENYFLEHKKIKRQKMLFSLKNFLLILIFFLFLFGMNFIGIYFFK